jgi:hypothetical protein
MLATQTLVAGILPLVCILWDFNQTNILNCRDPDNCGTRGTLYPVPTFWDYFQRKEWSNTQSAGFLLLMKWRLD